MLPPLYQTSLENQLSESELLFLNLLINVLQDIKEVSLEKIANALPVPILNVFGFEDLASGGDKDFNDMIVRVNLTIA
ncbi:DUF4114 domain-containing protein [Nostoc sp.]|uniref:DUF4114 domain-containing protein n=1 Tax=Nostoc sp. TaxID=1180 RepID=UPI003FA59B33